MTSHWPITPDDPEAADLAEGWTALEQLVAKSGTARMDLAAQTRLLAEIGRAARRRRLVQMSTMAAAACLLVALAFAWRGRSTNEEIARQTSAPKATSSATLPRAMATPVVAAVSPTETFVVPDSVEPLPWIDPLDAELESTRAYAGEIEYRWRARSDRLSNLEEQARQLQAEWNAASL